MLFYHHKTNSSFKFIITLGRYLIMPLSAPLGSIFEERSVVLFIFIYLAINIQGWGLNICLPSLACIKAYNRTEDVLYTRTILIIIPKCFIGILKVCNSKVRFLSFFLFLTFLQFIGFFYIHQCGVQQFHSILKLVSVHILFQTKLLCTCFFFFLVILYKHVVVLKLNLFSKRGKP